MKIVRERFCLSAEQDAAVADTLGSTAASDSCPSSAPTPTISAQQQQFQNQQQTAPGALRVAGVNAAIGPV